MTPTLMNYALVSENYNTSDYNTKALIFRCQNSYDINHNWRLTRTHALAGSKYVSIDQDQR